MDDESWDNDIPSTTTTDKNNNNPASTKTSFGGFARGNDSSETKTNGFGAPRTNTGFGGGRGSTRGGGGFGNRESNGFGARRDNNEDGEKKERGCFNCGETGHRKDDCPNPAKPRELKCFNCQETGHRNTDCTNPAKPRELKCFNCQETGHRNTDCTNPKVEGSGNRESAGSGGFGSKGFGGFGKKAENGDSAGSSGFGSKGFGGFGKKDNNEDGEKKERGCFNCGETGHRKDDCPNPEKPRENKNECFNCGETGHRKDECTNPRKLKEGEKERERYIPDNSEDNEESLFQNFSVGINFTKQSEIPVQLNGQRAEEIVPLTSFEDAKLSDLLLSNVKKSNYTIPTPVQKYAIPTILKKRDLMACAQTGSGKTAAYVLPIMTNILADGIQSSAFSSIQEPQALILSPTRELASQIFSECKKFSYGSIIKSAILYGGVDTGFQLANLAKGCNILVATPGRLLDILEKQKISLAKVKYFVLDEADRMLDMGFEKTVREILTKGTIQAKGDRVTLMFSATFPEEIQKLAQDFLNDYLFLTVGIVGGANSDVQQILHKVGRNDKRNKVVEILNDIGTDKVMIFIEHKKQADILAFYLIQKGYPTTSLHGDRLQSQRELALKEFKNGKSNIIVCTSVAARGLDIEKVNHVINYDLPQTIDEYVHRIGRTGRCGNPGKAISFFDSESDNDTKLSRQLARILSQAKQQVPDWLSDTAADSIGTTFTGNDCTEDLRGKMSSLNVKVAIAPPDEEEW